MACVSAQLAAEPGCETPQERTSNSQSNFAHQLSCGCVAMRNNDLYTLSTSGTSGEFSETQTEKAANTCPSCTGCDPASSSARCRTKLKNSSSASPTTGPLPRLLAISFPACPAAHGARLPLQRRDSKARLPAWRVVCTSSGHGQVAFPDPGVEREGGQKGGAHTLGLLGCRTLMSLLVSLAQRGNFTSQPEAAPDASQSWPVGGATPRG